MSNIVLNYVWDIIRELYINIQIRGSKGLKINLRLYMQLFKNIIYIKIISKTLIKLALQWGSIQYLRLLL